MVTYSPSIAEHGISLASETKTDHEFAIGTVIASMRADVGYPYTLDTFAEMANYSPFHFARLFRHAIGIPPGEFLAALRFHRAKELILKSDLSITDICFEVGFSSLGTFSSRFKQLVGVNPADLRALPETLGPRLPDLANVEPRPILGIGATLNGEVTSPIASSGHLFVGIYPAGVPQGMPVAGTLLPGPGMFQLNDVPDGMYRLMAAMFPLSSDPIAHLLPSESVLVAVDPLPVIIGSGIPRRLLALRLRPAQPTDPPLLTALAPMALGLSE